jgi:Xaa-Pro aminopeptidase
MKDNFFAARQKTALEIVNSSGIDGILFTSLENIRYLSGFTGSDGAFLLTQKGGFFLTDSRYWTQSEEEVKESQIVHYKKKMDGITALISDLALKKVGFESASLTFSAHRALTETLAGGPELIPLEKELRRLRAVKDDRELALLKSAIDIASKAFLHVIETLHAGSWEDETAQEMEFFMKKNGAESISFDIIVASGKRSALPHGKASRKKIEKGDLILFDYGSKYNGYNSDETCTVVCGKPSPKQLKIYQTVKDAHDKAIEKVRPGIAVMEVDKAAREHIREAGYGEYFGHGTGHGTGLAIHEEPGVNWENQEILQEGMVFTVEPGIYLPDWGGVRIEDMVRVTSQGAEVLTYLTKELRVI